MEVYTYIRIVIKPMKRVLKFRNIKKRGMSIYHYHKQLKSSAMYDKNAVK